MFVLLVNMVGGRLMFFGCLVVFDVYSRFGRGGMLIVGSVELVFFRYVFYDAMLFLLVLCYLITSGILVWVVVLMSCSVVLGLTNIMVVLEFWRMNVILLVVRWKFIGIDDILVSSVFRWVSTVFAVFLVNMVMRRLGFRLRLCSLLAARFSMLFSCI